MSWRTASRYMLCYPAGRQAACSLAASLCKWHAAANPWQPFVQLTGCCRNHVPWQAFCAIDRLPQNPCSLNSFNSTNVMHVVNPANGLPAVLSPLLPVASAAALCHACNLLALVDPRHNHQSSQPCTLRIHLPPHWSCCARTTWVHSQCSDMQKLTLRCTHPAALHTAGNAMKPF